MFFSLYTSSSKCVGWPLFFSTCWLNQKVWHSCVLWRGKTYSSMGESLTGNARTDERSYSHTSRILWTAFQACSTAVLWEVCVCFKQCSELVPSPSIIYEAEQIPVLVIHSLLLVLVSPKLSAMFWVNKWVKIKWGKLLDKSVPPPPSQPFNRSCSIIS